MGDYTIHVYKNAKNRLGKSLTLERVLGNIKGIGGVVQDEIEGTALVSFGGTLKEFYERLGYDRGQVEIKPTTSYAPSGGGSIKMC